MKAFVACALASVAFASVPDRPGQSTTSTPAACQPAGALLRLADLPEASGLAINRRTPGRLWAHNDSGPPVLFAIDAASGKTTGQVRISGASVEDWEAMAAGACPGGSCLYIGDIGDNEAGRKRVTIYRVPEPADGAASATVNGVFHATYPDGAHDAETLLVSSAGQLFIVTKGETGPIALYRFPRELVSGGTVRLERVGAITSGEVNAASRITDGAVSPDGAWTVLRTTSNLVFYRSDEFLAGKWRDVQRVDLATLKEAQGEGVALGTTGIVFVAGEGGGKNQPGTLASFMCMPKAS